MNEVIIYKTKDKKTQIEVRFENDTVWLTQQQMAELFRQTKQNISLHINNCFKEKELHAVSVVKESLTTAADGKRYKTKYTGPSSSAIASKAGASIMAYAYSSSSLASQCKTPLLNAKTGL